MGAFAFNTAMTSMVGHHRLTIRKGLAMLSKTVSRLGAFILVALVMTLAGCLPLSVKPLFKDASNLTVDERLLGTWEGERFNVPREGEPDEQQQGNFEGLGEWTVKRHDALDGRYHIEVTSPPSQDAGTGEFVGALVELDGRYFLDLQDTGESVDKVNPWARVTRPPMHAFVRIEFDGDKIRVATVDTQQFIRLLRQNPDVIDHRWVTTPEEIGDEDSGWPVITADTEALRAFVKEHLSDEQLFPKWQVMQRVEQPGEQ
jgi:hypothetical protein